MEQENKEPKETDHNGNPITYWGGKDVSLNIPDQDTDFINQLKQEVSDWQSRYTKLKEENKELRSEIDKHTNQVLKLDKENERLKEKVKEAWDKAHQIGFDKANKRLDMGEPSTFEEWSKENL